MEIEQTAVITPELKRRLLDFEESTGSRPLEPWLENLIAASDDEDIAYWVAVSHGLLTSTVAAHLGRASSFADPNIHSRLSINPEAPLEAMRRTPVNEHLYYGLMRFIERSGFSLDSSEAVALMTYVESGRLLGEVWDSIASPKA